MRGLPEIPDEDVAEYWQLVRDALVAGGMSKKEAVVVAKAYREYMKPASWTIYNRDPEDSAEAAKDYAAWMREEKEQSAEPKEPPRGNKRFQHQNDLPSQREIAHLPAWAQVSLAVRCAQRALPQLLNYAADNSSSEELVGELKEGVMLATKSVMTAHALIERHIPLRMIAGLVDTDPFAGDHRRLASRSMNVVTSAMSSVAVVGDGEEPISRYPAEAIHQTAMIGVEASVLRSDFHSVRVFAKNVGILATTPVPPAVFGPLWPEGPPADWPELPKPTKLKLTVRVPDGLDDVAVREKLKTLTTALARLNVAGGGHGLKLIPPVEFTQEQDKGRADVLREEEQGPKGRGHARRGR